ncbi:MAG: nicotinate (nicotinamide) nucleotide adenylyltransferase [Akkermansiaceae bacterium]
MDKETSTNTRRICLFGGTFDPIHHGHVHIAQCAVKSLELEQVIFLPCRQSPHKTGKQHAPDKHRLAMCQLAIKDLSWATVDEHDLISPAPSYSWRTVEAMQARYPNDKLYWLMGTDQWLALPRWNRSTYLASLVEFIVFTRGTPPEPRSGYSLHAIQGDHPASSTQIRQHTEAHQKWLHPNVAQYINDNHLYQSPKADG